MRLFFWRRKPKQKAIVSLGGLGRDKGKRTTTIAEQNPDKRVFEIDVGLAPHESPKNWQHINAEFLTGLKKLKNSSTDVIISEMALGHYDKAEKSGVNFIGHEGMVTRHRYTTDVMQLAYKKLRKGGKIIIVVGHQNALNNVEKALEKTRFKIREKKELTYEEGGRTASLRNYRDNPTSYSRKIPLTQITAEK